MPNAPIAATTPSTVSATFDSWAFTIRSDSDGLLPFNAPLGPQPAIRFAARATKFRTREDGVQERSPLDSDIVDLTIPDLYAAAAEKPYIATALAAMLTAIPTALP